MIEHPRFLNANALVYEILQYGVIKYLNGIINYGPYARILEKN